MWLSVTMGTDYWPITKRKEAFWKKPNRNGEAGQSVTNRNRKRRSPATSGSAPGACALCLVMSGEVQDGGAKLILLQVRDPGQVATGFSRYVRGMVAAEVHRSRPHLSCLSSGDRSATSAP